MSLKYVFVRKLNQDTLPLIETIDELENDELNYIKYTPEIYREIKEKFKPNYSEILLVFYDEKDYTYLNDILYSEINPYESNLIVLTEDIDIRNKINKEGYLMVTDTLKNTNLQSLIRVYVNMPIELNGENIYYCQFPYIVQKDALTKVGCDLFNFNDSNFGDTLITSVFNEPVNTYIVLESYKTGLMLYEDMIKDQKVFKDNKINKGNLSILQNHILSFPLSDDKIEYF